MTVSNTGQQRGGVIPMMTIEDVMELPVEHLARFIGQLEMLKAVAWSRLAAPAPTPVAEPAHEITQATAAALRSALPLKTIRFLSRSGRIPSVKRGRHRLIRLAEQGGRHDRIARRRARRPADDSTGSPRAAPGGGESRDTLRTTTDRPWPAQTAPQGGGTGDSPMIVDIDNPVLADMSDAELENYFAPRAAYTVVRGHADTRRQVPWGDLLPDEQAAIVGELLLARRAFEMNRGRYPVTQEARVVFRPLAALSDPERAAAERGLRQCAADLQAESAEITQSLRPRDGR